MSRWLLAVLVVVFYVLHQDFWLWSAADPLAFGLFPPGLLYHVAYAVAAAGLMWLLVRFAWPSHLEDEVERLERAQRGRR